MAPDSAITVTVTVFKPGTRTSSPATVTVALLLPGVATTFTDVVPTGFSTVAPAEISSSSTTRDCNELFVEAAGTIIVIPVSAVDPS